MIRSLPARFERVAAGLRLTVDELGARYPLTIDPIAQQAYLKASNTRAGDRLGVSVSVSCDTVVVGASLENSNATGVNGNQSNNSALDAGAAYVFELAPLASVTFRNGGSNPASYAATPMVIGSTFTALVDNNLAAQLTSLLLAFDTPFSLALGGGLLAAGRGTAGRPTDLRLWAVRRRRKGTVQIPVSVLGRQSGLE